MSDSNNPENAGEKSLGTVMKGWFSRKPETPAAGAEPVVATPSDLVTPETPATSASPDSAAPADGGSFMERMKAGLSRTRSSFSNGMATLLIGGKEIDDELLEDIETQMLVADIGVDATRRIIDSLTERVSRNELTHSNALYKALQSELAELLSPHVAPLVIDTTKKPFVILVVGVNGVGKTTTIGKLAKRFSVKARA
jgi:fused signal recognition particle receptor